jgi:hypothetical protein
MTGRRAARRDPDPIASTIRSGDLVVLQLPDGAIDVDPQLRPSLAVTGRARVTVVAGRRVLLDDDLSDGVLAVPPGASHVAVQADGDADPSGGWAGWHDRTRVARVGSQCALAAGCTLSVDATGGGPVLQWDMAGAVARGAHEITTRFTRPVTTVAIALTGSSATSLAPSQLLLHDAAVATDRSGNPVPPTAVSLGDTSVLVYRIVPDRGATTVAVSVSSGADWIVSGVVGCTEPVDQVAAQIARQRLTGVAAKLLAVAGPGVGLEWRDPPSPSAAKKAAKKTAKKAAKKAARTTTKSARRAR